MNTITERLVYLYFTKQSKFQGKTNQNALIVIKKKKKKILGSLNQTCLT